VAKFNAAVTNCHVEATQFYPQTGLTEEGGLTPKQQVEVNEKVTTACEAKLEAITGKQLCNVCKGVSGIFCGPRRDTVPCGERQVRDCGLVLFRALLRCLVVLRNNKKYPFVSPLAT
jgi:hypothetical protein